jgi:hypothetical protein
MVAMSGGGAILSYPTALSVMMKSAGEDGRISMVTEIRNGADIGVKNFEHQNCCWRLTEKNNHRLVREKWGNMQDKERSRKATVILDFLLQEAEKGKLYTENNIASILENKKGLGAAGTIRKSIKVLQDKGYIRFISNKKAASQFNITGSSSPHGYLCVEGMKNKDSVLYLPTHYRDRHSGKGLRIKEE